MKMFVRNMNLAERKTWRAWQALWVLVYVFTAAGLITAGSFIADPVEVADAVTFLPAR